MSIITVNEKHTQNYIEAGEKIIENNDFLKDISELMENEKFNKFFLRIDIQDQFYKKCLEEGKISISYSNYQECRMFTINEIKKKSKRNVPLYPFLSIIVFGICVGIVIHNTALYKTKKSL